MRTKYLLLLLLSYIKVICNVTRSVIGIRGLESESVKNNSDSFQIPIPTNVYRGKNDSI